MWFSFALASDCHLILYFVSLQFCDHLCFTGEVKETNIYICICNVELHQNLPVVVVAVDRYKVPLSQFFFFYKSLIATVPSSDQFSFFSRCFVIVAFHGHLHLVAGYTIKFTHISNFPISKSSSITSSFT